MLQSYSISLTLQSLMETLCFNRLIVLGSLKQGTSFATFYGICSYVYSEKEREREREREMTNDCIDGIGARSFNSKGY